MSRHVHWLVRRRIHGLFTAGLPPRVYRALLAELSRCPACAHRYEKYLAAEAALCGTGTGPSPFALERVRAGALDSAEAPPDRPAWPRPLLVTASALAAAAVVLLLVWRPPERSPLSPGTRLEPVGVVARGGPSDAASEVGIRIFRVAADGRTARPAELLGTGDTITFTYTNVRPGISYLSLLGIQADGAIRWYYPDGGGSAPIAQDKVDESLADGIRLAVRHQPGWLRVTALFSPAPLGRARVEEALRSAGSRALERVEAVPGLGPDVVEHSLLVEIQP